MCVWLSVRVFMSVCKRVCPRRIRSRRTYVFKLVVSHAAFAGDFHARLLYTLNRPRVGKFRRSTNVRTYFRSRARNNNAQMFFVHATIICKLGSFRHERDSSSLCSSHFWTCGPRKSLRRYYSFEPDPVFELGSLLRTHERPWRCVCAVECMGDMFR